MATDSDVPHRDFLSIEADDLMVSGELCRQLTSDEATAARDQDRATTHWTSFSKASCVPRADAPLGRRLGTGLE